MKKILLGLMLMGSGAHAASTTFILNIPCPATTNVVITPSAACTMNGVSIGCNNALTAGETFATVAVTQAAGAGPNCTPSISLGSLTGSASPTDFVVNGMSIQAGANGLPTGYNGGATVTSKP